MILCLVPSIIEGIIKFSIIIVDLLIFSLSYINFWPIYLKLCCLIYRNHFDSYKLLCIYERLNFLLYSVLVFLSVVLFF